MKLKPPPHDPHLCAVTRCRAESAVIDGTCEMADCDVPLCDRHWEERLEMAIPGSIETRKIKDTTTTGHG